MKNLFLIFFFSFSCLAANAQEVSVHTDKTEILIGEQVQLKLQAIYREGQEVNWFDIDSIPGFEILERSGMKRDLSSGLVTVSETFTLTSWDSGTQRIPSFRLERSRTRPLKIEVSYTGRDPELPYHEIKEIIPVERPQESKWYWYLILGAVLLILFRLFFPSAKGNVVKKEAPRVDPYHEAITGMNELQQKMNGDPKEFYTSLVHVFRNYLYHRKNIWSYSQTTDDLSQKVKELKLPAESYSQLVQSLRLSDMVKFARYVPDKNESEETWQVIRQSIETIEKQSHAV